MKKGRRRKIITTFPKKNYFQLTNISIMLCEQKSPVHQEEGFPGGDTQHMDIATYRLNQHRDRFSENMKDFFVGFTRLATLLYSAAGYETQQTPWFNMSSSLTGCCAVQ